VRIPSHIRQSRHGIFFFRIVVPKALRSCFDGRTEIKRSLHTRDMRAALVQARHLTTAAYQLFDLVKCSMAPKIDPNDPSTWLPENVKGRFEYTIEEDLNAGTRKVQIKTDSKSPESVAAGRAVALAIEAKKTLSLGKIATDDPARLAEDDNLRAELAAIVAGGSESAPAPVLAASEPPPRRTKIDTDKLSQKDRERLLSALWGTYAAQKKDTEWDSRTTTDYNQKFNLFLGWIADRPIHWITKIDYSTYKNWLLTEYEWAKGKRGLNARTVDKYTTAVNGFFNWAQASGYFPEGQSLPTAKQTIMSKSAVKKRAKKREANRNFRPEELSVAFDAEAYALENQVVHHFWAPLLALFTGARRAEVSQLLIRDVAQLPDGRWYIDITDDDYSKNVKNDNARRTVPLHPTLIEIGFLDYLNEVKAAKQGPELFPGVEANKHGEKGNAVGNAWRRYLVRRGLRTEQAKDENPDTLTFHSLRHTAISVLREAGVPYDLRCQMVGHEAEGQQADYGGAASVAALAEKVLPVFMYPGLDFSKLRYKVGSLDIKKKSGYTRNPRTEQS
jgi:integrase